jgi:hypothetical protein
MNESSLSEAYICQEKNDVFAEVLSPLKIIGSANRKSANRKKIYGPLTANLQIVTFAECPQI